MFKLGMLTGARGAFAGQSATPFASSLRADGPVNICCGCRDGAMCRLMAGNFCSPACRERQHHPEPLLESEADPTCVESPVICVKLFRVESPVPCLRVEKGMLGKSILDAGRHSKLSIGRWQPFSLVRCARQASSQNTADRKPRVHDTCKQTMPVGLGKILN